MKDWRVLSFNTAEPFCLFKYNPFPDQQKSTSETFFEMCITSHTCFHFEYPIQVWEDFWGCFINFEFMCPSLTMSSSFLTLMIHLSDFGCKVFSFTFLCSVCENVVQHKSPSDAFLRRLKDALHTQMLLPYAGFSNFLDESIFFDFSGLHLSKLFYLLFLLNYARLVSSAIFVPFTSHQVSSISHLSAFQHVYGCK